jgi:hypothetical protein
MIRIKKVAVLIGILIESISCFAQIPDSTSRNKQDSLNFPKRVVRLVNDNFAVTRPFNVDFSSTAPYNFQSKRGADLIPNGRVIRFQQTRVSANITFLKRKTWILGTTIGYRLTSSKTEFDQNGVENITVATDLHYLFSTLNLTYFSSLFGKRMIYNTSALVDGSEKHLERLKGIITATMVLKANQRTKMTAGILVNIDPSSQSPFIPTFSYEHKFSDGFIADIVLPRSINLKRFIGNSGRISLGTQLDQTSFYLYNLDGTSQKYEYRQLDINSGLTYEHALGKYFMITGKSGVKITPTGKIFKKEESFADPVYRTSPDPAFYFNVGISFNPFSVFGKKD